MQRWRVCWTDRGTAIVRHRPAHVRVEPLPSSRAQCPIPCAASRRALRVLSQSPPPLFVIFAASSDAGFACKLQRNRRSLLPMAAARGHNPPWLERPSAGSSWFLCTQGIKHSRGRARRGGYCTVQGQGRFAVASRPGPAGQSTPIRKVRANSRGPGHFPCHPLRGLAARADSAGPARR